MSAREILSDSTEFSREANESGPLRHERAEKLSVLSQSEDCPPGQVNQRRPCVSELLFGHICGVHWQKSCSIRQYET
jgi:hypothetical protein